MIKCEAGGQCVGCARMDRERQLLPGSRTSESFFNALSTFQNEYVKNKNSINQLTLTLSVWNCYVKNPKKKIQKLRDEPPRQGHILQEYAAHKQAFYHIL